MSVYLSCLSGVGDAAGCVAGLLFVVCGSPVVADGGLPGAPCVHLLHGTRLPERRIVAVGHVLSQRQGTDGEQDLEGGGHKERPAPGLQDSSSTAQCVIGSQPVVCSGCSARHGKSCSLRGEAQAPRHDAAGRQRDRQREQAAPRRQNTHTHVPLLTWKAGDPALLMPSNTRGIRKCVKPPPMLPCMMRV